jgi:hypothetical protein
LFHIGYISDNFYHDPMGVKFTSLFLSLMNKASYALQSVRIYNGIN